MALLDELRRLSLGTLETGLFKAIIKNDPLFPRLPAKRISGDPYKYNREKTRPPVGPVGSEGEFPEGAPTFDPIAVNLKRLGGQTPYDDFDINRTSDQQDPRTPLVEQLGLATLEEVGRWLIMGDESVNALEWNGLKKLSTTIPATQKFQIADTSTNVLALRDLWKAEAALRVGKQEAFYIVNPATVASLKDKLKGDTAAAEKMLPNFGRPVFHFGAFPVYESDFVDVLEDGVGTGVGTLTSIYLVGGGPQGLTALIPNVGDKAARIQTIGPRERKGGAIVRAEIQMGLALHSALALVRITGIDPAK